MHEHRLAAEIEPDLERWRGAVWRMTGSAIGSACTALARIRPDDPGLVIAAHNGAAFEVRRAHGSRVARSRRDAPTAAA